MKGDSKKRVTITLSPKSHEKIKQYAKSKHTSVSGAIEDWIWNQLEFDFKKDEEKKTRRN